MAITGEIRWDEGPIVNSNTKSKATLKYVLFSDDPENDERIDAMDWMEVNAPYYLYGLVLSQLDVTKRLSETATEAIWDGFATYSSLPAPKQLKTDKNKDKAEKQETMLTVRNGSAGSLLMTSSREFIEEIFDNSQSAGTSPWNWETDDQINRLLNLQSGKDEDWGMFQTRGINVPIGTVEVVVQTTRLNANIVEDGYLINAALLSGKNVVNEKVYAGFPVRSLKLISFEADQKGGRDADNSINLEPWEVSYTFAYAPEVKLAELNANLPPGLEGRPWTTGPKRGWDYLDVLYTQSQYTPDTGGGIKFVIPQAKRAAIHRIYEESDFAADLII